MGTSREIKVIPPAEMAEAIARKVESGAYASVSEIVCDGVRALIGREDALETWLREDVLPGHAEYLADPGQGVPADEVLSRLQVRRGAARAV